MQEDYISKQTTCMQWGNLTWSTRPWNIIFVLPLVKPPQLLSHFIFGCHNQIQKLRRKNFMHVLQMCRNDNRFKFTSLYHYYFLWFLCCQVGDHWFKEGGFTWQFPKVVCYLHGYMSLWVLAIWRLFRQKIHSAWQCSFGMDKSKCKQNFELRFRTHATTA